MMSLHLMMAHFWKAPQSSSPCPERAFLHGLHKEHIGLTKCQLTASQLIQWLSIDNNIEDYIDEGFSFCLNTYIRRNYSFKVPIDRKILMYRQTFTMTNNMAFAGLWVMLIKIYTSHRWHHWLCKERHLMSGCKAPNW